MRTFVLTLAIFFSLILQTTVLPLLKIAGVMPDLLLVLVIFAALHYGLPAGWVVGLSVGLIQDFLNARYLGLGALSFFATSYIIGFLEDKVFKENPFVFLILVFLGSFISNIVFFVGQSLVGSFSFSFSLFWRVLIPSALYNVFVATVLLPLFTKLTGHNASMENRVVRSHKDF